MTRRAFTSWLLAFCLILTSLAAVVAETRMAAAGGYCGTGAPQILLDASGLPLLGRDGAALAVPECPACNLTLALSAPAPQSTAAHPILLGMAEPLLPPSLFPLVVHLGGQARAPPRAA